MSVHHRIGQPPGLTSQHVLDAGGLGVLPEQVPTTGEHGGSVLANEAADAANAGKELRAVVTSPPSGDDIVSFTMQSDGSFDLELTAGVDATYTVGYTVYIDGVSDGATESTITVGDGGELPPSGGGESAAVAAGGIGKRRRRAYAGYPRRILLDGALYTVQSPDEERRLLKSFIERESVQVANDVAAGRVEKAKKRRLVVRRAERRVDSLADREAEHIRRLHDEDEEILTMIAGAGWLH